MGWTYTKAEWWHDENNPELDSDLKRKVGRQIALLVLESAVAIIQSYVFAVLSTLYSIDINWWSEEFVACRG